MGGAEWSIRSVKSPIEVEAVRTLFIEYQAWVGSNECFAEFEDELASLPGQYSLPRGILVLAWLNGEAVGCIALRPYSGALKFCEIKRLFVRQGARGAGIGRNLVRRAIRHAKSRKYQQVVLESLPKMTEAHALYESFGFRRVNLSNRPELIEMQLTLI